MKRPDGWDELYLEAYRKEHSGKSGYGSPERAMFEAGADAQARTIYEWGNGGCIEHPITCETTVLLRRECDECWQELLRGIE